MKRRDHLYEKIYSIDNLNLAQQNARKGKAHQYGVKAFDKNPEANILELHDILQKRTYQTSAYKTFTIYEPKERLIFCLPFYPDRIAHHAIMNILEPIFTATFTADTYSCIKGKGIHGFHQAMKTTLKDIPGTQYCLKMDIKKFYPSIDHGVLKQQLRRKFKDADLLALLDEIINSAPGVPIGNYVSQYFANFYLSGMDHFIKEVLKVKYYFRYADDIVILGADKPSLHELLHKISTYLQDNLKLTVKSNYRVFPVAAQGIAVVGYVYFHTHILLRKSIKQSFARMMARDRNPASLAAYWGWAKHANCKHLIKKLTA